LTAKYTNGIRKQVMMLCCVKIAISGKPRLISTK